MKKFEFALQKILDLKNLQKSQAEGEFATALAAENKIQETLEMVAMQRASTITSGDNGNDINSMILTSRYLVLLDQRKEKLIQELTQAKLITEEKREIAKKIMVEVKGLEKIKESDFAKWQESVNQEEEAAIDDIVTAKYHQK